MFQDSDVVDDEEFIPTPVYRFPTDNLAKGSVIAHAQMESALDLDRSTKKYGLAVLGLMRQIESALAERGLDVVIRVTEAEGLRILTDEEALEYTAHRFEVETRARVRNFRRMQKLDRGLLSEVSRTQLDIKLTELGRRVQADRRAKKDDFEFKPVERKTPGRRM